MPCRQELIVFRFLGVKQAFAFKSIYDQLLFFYAAAVSRCFLETDNFLKIVALEKRNCISCALTFSRISKFTPFSNLIHSLILLK